MIKVCHVTSVHPAYDLRIFRKECISLARAGYDVYLVQKGESGEADGVHIAGFGAGETGRLKRMLLTARRAYQKALEVDADLYHLHDPELLPYGLKLKRKGKMVIFDSHERYVDQIRTKYYLPGWCRSLIAGCYGVYERFALKRIDGLIFPCLINGKNPFEGQCRRFATVNNVPRREELYDRYDETVPKYERSLVYLGALTAARGITQLVQAAGECGCTVYLGGEFSPASYRAEVEALPGYSCVQYLGKLDRAGVLDILQRCQVGVAAPLNVGQYNRYDNLLTKVYEYMSLGIPAILTRSPYNEKAAGEYQFGVCVDPENTQEYAAAMRALLDDPEGLRRMGENGRRAVKEKFNWAVEEKNLLNLYQEILSEKGGAPL